jgi:phosphoglycerol transferase MdoB-like AlkP superfamily enzyme
MLRRVPVPLLLSVVLMPLGLRFASLYLNDLGLPWASLRGFAGDVLFAGLIWLIVAWLLGWAQRDRTGASPWRQRLPRWGGTGLAVTLVMLFAAFAYGNLEHILANDANVDPGNLKFLNDETFRQGSAVAISHPILMSIGLVLTLFLAVLGALRPAPAPLTRPAMGVLAGLLIMQWLPFHGATAAWAQDNFMLGILRMVGSDRAQATSAVADEQAQPADLSGERILKPLTETRPDLKTPNILVIMLEGLSGMNVPLVAQRHGVKLPGVMKNISTLAAKNVAVTHVISHQRQTDRGEYSIICGDLPKLSRDTPRMSDFAVHGADTQCLPAYLARQGYQTLYLQPAPMAFMMKDQFMEKAGFERSLGADYFAKGYAKGGWGIDDRGFFEQSLTAIKEMDAKKEPWMATLMTVGTHHPFVVPKNFRKKPGEKPFTRALRYTDRHLNQMLARMKREGMLKNTIVVITSDESRGITEKYKGVTRAISQNWGLMVMLLPDGQTALIDHEIYGQQDLAITLLDYAGLYTPEAQVTGRSMFRRYATPRVHAFANIFKRKAYLYEPDGRLTSCKENYTQCSAYTRDDDKLFGPGWTEADADPVTVQTLRRMVSQSARKRGAPKALNRSKLVHQNTGIINLEEASRRMYLIGGQFLYAPPGKRLRVDLDIEIDGEGSAVELGGELNIEYKDRFKFPANPIFQDGDRLELSFWYEQPGPLKRVDVEFFVRKLTPVPSRAIIRKAEARFVDEAPGLETPRWEITNHRLSYRDGRKWTPYDRQPRTRRTLSVHSDDGFGLHGCLKRDAQGRLLGKCSGLRFFAISGPRAKVPANSRLKARYLVRGIAQSAKLSVELASKWGKKKHADTEPVLLEAGKTVEIVAEADVTDPIYVLGARLRVAGAKNFEFEILEGGVEIIPADAPAPGPMGPVRTPKSSAPKAPASKARKSRRVRSPRGPMLKPVKLTPEAAKRAAQ